MLVGGVRRTRGAVVAQAIHPKEDQHRRGRPFGGAQAGEAKRAAKGEAAPPPHAVAVPVRTQCQSALADDDAAALPPAAAAARSTAAATSAAAAAASAAAAAASASAVGCAGGGRVPGTDWSQPIREEIRKERAAQFRRTYGLQNAEVVAGRATMAAGLWGIVQEVVTGRSFPEQLGVGMDWASLSAAEAVQIHGQQAVALALLALAVVAAHPRWVPPGAGTPAPSKTWTWTLQTWRWHRPDARGGPPTP